MLCCVVLCCVLLSPTELYCRIVLYCSVVKFVIVKTTLKNPGTLIALLRNRVATLSSLRRNFISGLLFVNFSWLQRSSDHCSFSNFLFGFNNF